MMSKFGIILSAFILSSCAVLSNYGSSNYVIDKNINSIIGSPSIKNITFHINNLEYLNRSIFVNVELPPPFSKKINLCVENNFYQEFPKEKNIIVNKKFIS